ncbi:hypothetical protein BGX28_001336 [Mortierella sp. GBA30]|nr:hypothetical protein BGX28_001336 [Mortierella sp. GBA30]
MQSQQHQQLLGKSKSESELTAHSKRTLTQKPDIAVAEVDTQKETVAMDSEHSSAHSASQGRTHLAIDTTSGAAVAVAPLNSSSMASTPRMSMASPRTASTPTSEGGAAAPSSRRGSLRTMPATLPRSALQEETIALFKQYRHLIPCAKCFSRNTIQRDGMSDGNLRFKCRPPVSMSLICNKSYSESKIRNMIAGVVYGHTLPDSGTLTSTCSSENVLALAPPTTSTPRSSRRPSHKHEDQDERDRKLLLLQEHESSMMMNESQQSFEEMNINGGHQYLPDDRRPSLVPSRRGSVQHPLIRRSSLAGQNPPAIESEDASMLPPSSSSNQLQVPGSPMIESEECRRPRAYGNRAVTPTTPLMPTARKLHHSHSHPNIGQHRHQPYLDQQQEHLREQRGGVGYSSQSQHYHAQQQQQQHNLQRHMLRRESAQYHQPRSETAAAVTADRRLSHPSALQPSSSSRHLSVTSNSLNDAALSPALSSSSQSSPGRESFQQPSPRPAGTPQMGSSSSAGGRYEDTTSSASLFHRRMSQPHPSSQQRSFGQMPPPPTGLYGYYYDRRASDIEDFNDHLREKYERLNASTTKHQNAKNKHAQSPQLPYDQTNAAHNLRVLQTEPMPMRHTHSLPLGNNSSSGRHVYSTPSYHHSPSIYYQQQSMDMPQPDLSPYEADDRAYARVSQGFRRSSASHTLVRSNSNPNLYSTSVSSVTSNRDLNSVLPRNTIKLTCFPNAATTYPTNLDEKSTSSVVEVDDTSKALALQLNRSSKIVIEITQPRSAQAFEKGFLPRSSLSSSSSSSSFLTTDNQAEAASSVRPLVRSIRHAVSHPNFLERSASSILGRRRSVSPDGDEENNYGSSKKRRADSLRSVGGGAEDELGNHGVMTMTTTSAAASAAAAEAAAAAVVAAAANAARRQNSIRENNTASPSTSGGGLQIVGLDYPTGKISGSQKEIGLGLQVPTGESSTSIICSPEIKALNVAKAPSFVALEDQKDMGIDYSLFTRVETAGWRILIPPNVEASFKSEDFGLVLKPKLEGEASWTESQANTDKDEIENEIKETVATFMETGEANSKEKNLAHSSGDEDMEVGAMETKQDIESAIIGKQHVVEKESVLAQGTPKAVDAEAEHEMDELEED